MLSSAAHFPAFILASLIVFVAILYFVLRARATPLNKIRIAIVTAIVVVAGMLFAKFGTFIGLPWWIYYTLPALVTLLLPPVAFRMSRSELWQYLVLAFISAPVIHVFFSFFFGWYEYMPLIHVPPLQDLLG